MKVFKNIILCIVVSLTIQMAGFFYVNNYFLDLNASIVSQKVGDSSVNNKTASNNETKVPSNAKSINTSYDASYIAYYLGDELYIVNTKTGKNTNVSFSKGVKISFYKWLPDRNRMLIAEKKTDTLSISYYDIDKAQKDSIADLGAFSPSVEVKDIEASPLTNVIYIKVANSVKSDAIYWVNIMKSKKIIPTETSNIGKIEVIPHEDKMVYEDITGNKVYVTGIRSALSFFGSTKTCLLETDNNDNIYIGNIDANNNIDKIFFGTLKENTSSWKILQLGTLVSKENILVTASGKVYIKDNLKSILKEVKTGKEIAYRGIFLQAYSDGIASLSNGMFVKTSLIRG